MSMKIKHGQGAVEFDFVGGHSIQFIPHLHREVELICLFEGKMIAYADSVRHTLEGGDIFITFPNQIHSYERVGDGTHIGFVFKPDLLPEMTESFAMGFPRTPVIKGALLRPSIRALVDALASTRGKDDVSHLSTLRRGYLLALLASLLPELSVVKLPLSESESLRAIVSFCTQNYNEQLSLSLLQEKLHLNKYYISHLFSGRLGLGFNDYINSLRVLEACRYLLRSDEPIARISTLVGFQTPRTFNRAFIKQMGVSPSEYRRGAKKEDEEAYATGDKASTRCTDSV